MKVCSFFRLNVVVFLACGVALIAGRQAQADPNEEIRDLIARTRDGNWEVRVEAVRALGVMAVDDPTAMRALARISSRDGWNSMNFVRFFADGDLRKELDRLLDQFEESVYHAGPDGSIRQSSDVPSPDEARQIVSSRVRELAQSYREQKKALLDLAHELDSPRPRSVNLIDGLDKSILPVAQAALEHAVQQTLISVRDLSALAVHNSEAMNRLISRVTYPHAAVRAEAISSLSQLALRHPAARERLVRELYRGLSYADDGRDAVVRALAQSATEHADVRDMLLWMANRGTLPRLQVRPGRWSPARHVSRIVPVEALGLGAIRNADMRSALLTLARDPNEEVRDQAIRSIQEMRSRVSAAPLEDRQALAADFFNDLIQSQRGESGEAPSHVVEEVLAVLARQDPALRLQLLRRASGVDIPLLQRAQARSLERWQGPAIRVLQRTYDLSFAPEQAEFHGTQVVALESTTYRDAPRVAGYGESAEIAAFLEGRNRFSRFDPRGPGASEQALLHHISQFLRLNGGTCPNLADVIR